MKEQQDAVVVHISTVDEHALQLNRSSEAQALTVAQQAGIGDAYFDLASGCCYHGYDQARREQLLLAYFGRLDGDAAERLRRMCWLFDYIKELWLAVRALEA